MKVKLLIISLLFTSLLGAQQKTVRIGGPNADRAKDWPKAVAKPNRTEAEVVAELRRYLDVLVQRDLFSGTLLVAKGDQTLFLESYGMADKDFNVPNTADTKYNLGSINKVFTQVALMQLRDEGKIDYSKTLRTYLPDYPAAISGRITIQQMLRHTSGLGDIFGPEYDAMAKDRLRNLSDYLPLFIDKPLEFTPGERSRYSNVGYILLGLVIEKLSGMPYEDYVRTKIYAPLGMKDTGGFDTDAIVSKRAVGYTRGADGVLRTNTYLREGRGSSAGGGFSTVGDLLKFTRGANKILSPATAQAFIGTNMVGWAGGGPGVNGDVSIDRGYTVIALSNYDSPAASEVAKNVRKVLGLTAE